jgi:hypothetical protein
VIDDRWPKGTDRPVDLIGVEQVDGIPASAVPGGWGPSTPVTPPDDLVAGGDEQVDEMAAREAGSPVTRTPRTAQDCGVPYCAA